MRLFTGLEIPAEIVRNLERLLERLRPAAQINWSQPANLHITTKFIGAWPEERLAELKAALGAMPAWGPIDVQILKLGFFPNPHSPRSFWCGIESRELPRLAADTDRVTSALGIAAETRDYSPHLTLARIKDRPNLQPLREVVAALPSLDFGRFEARSFFLYQSTLRPAGSVYTKLAEFPLTK